MEALPYAAAASKPGRWLRASKAMNLVRSKEVVMVEALTGGGVSVLIDERSFCHQIRKRTKKNLHIHEQR